MSKKLLVLVALIAISAVSIAAFAGSTGPISVWYDDECRADIAKYELLGTITNNGAVAFHIDEVYIEGPGEFWYGLPIPTGILDIGQTVSVQSHFVGNEPVGWYRLNVKGVFVGATQQTHAHWSAHVSGHCGGSTPTYTPTDIQTTTPTLTITETPVITGTITNVPATSTPTVVAPTPTNVTETPQATEDPAMGCAQVRKPSGPFKIFWLDGSGNWNFGSEEDGGDGTGQLVLSKNSAPEGSIFKIEQNGFTIVIFTIKEGECVIQNDNSPTPEATNKGPCTNCGTQQNECFVKGYLGLRNWYFDARQAINSGRHVVVTQGLPFQFDGYDSFNYNSLIGEVSLAAGWEDDMVDALDDSIGGEDAEGNEITDLVSYESCSLACEWAVMVMPDGSFGYLYIYGATPSNTSEMIRIANPDMSAEDALEHAFIIHDAFTVWGNANPHNTFAFFRLDGEVIDLNYPESPR